jgi:hypothetical protein
MFNKSLVCAALVAVAVAAQAQTAPTLGEIGAANAELKLQELRNKLSEAKAKEPASGPLSPMPVAAPVLPPPEPGLGESLNDKVQVVALYGVGSRISAELRYRGWTQVVTPANLPARIGPWRIESITANQVSMVRVGDSADKAVAKRTGASKKSLAKAAAAEPERQELYFASETPDAQVPATNSRNPGYSPFGMPSSTLPPFVQAPGPRMPVPALPPITK